jgi:hypothetical protein
LIAPSGVIQVTSRCGYQTSVTFINMICLMAGTSFSPGQLLA